LERAGVEIVNLIEDSRLDSSILSFTPMTKSESVPENIIEATSALKASSVKGRGKA
ncbi:MAG: hypothetical protein JWO89_1802, partial [Verrucomicrobiaceae bacterium]|nr:hypothetical protein [Verrucomicrobiaceae bacterium]